METEFIGNTISFGNNETINRGISQRVSGGTIYGGLQTTQGNNHQQNMTNAHHLYTPELEQNLLEAANEIKTLLQQLEPDNSSQTNSQKMMVVAQAVSKIETQNGTKIIAIAYSPTSSKVWYS